MSNEEPTKTEIGPNGETIISDPELAKWYKEGFRFAINFLYSIVPSQSDQQMNQENFKNHVNNILQTIKIEDNFFENHPILPANENYPQGLCPGPDGTCIDCPDGSFGS